VAGGDSPNVLLWGFDSSGRFWSRLCENAKTISRECDALRFDARGTLRIVRTAAKSTGTIGQVGGSVSFHTVSAGPGLCGPPP